MKVFALGIEDKKQSDLDEKCETKIPIDTPLSASPQPPQIVIAKPPKRRYGFTCGVLSWFLAAFCIVLLCLAISEVTYHRQRDQAFLRLKWAELRQRMLGYELLSQQQDLDRLSLEQSSAKEVLPQKSIDPPKPEIMKSFPKNPDEESGSEEVSMRENDKATFLRTLVDALRRNAEKLGLSGDMQVHVVELQPMDEKEEPITFDRSIADGFGEVAMPRPFGPWQAANDYENSRIAGPWQFDRRPGLPIFPMPRFEDHIDYEEPKFNEFLNQPQADGGWWGNQGNQHQMKMVQQPTVQNPPFFIFPQQFSQQQQMHQAQQFPAPFPLPQETQREPHPWYMNQQQIPSIFNEEKQQFPFNPHPIGALTLDHPKPEWIDNTVTVNTNDNRPPHFPRFQPNSVDINSDASPETVSSDAVVDENNNIPDSVKAWIQPQNDEQDEHVITPDPTLETIDDGKFLPIRTEDQKVDSLDDAVMDPSHFLQIDDPKAYAQDN